MAEALEYLHGVGVVHRDLKAENVGFDGDGCLKLYDFGLALQLRGKNNSGAPRGGSVCYMAPECFFLSSSSQRQTTASDVYTFGLVLWEILSLQKAFDGYTAKQHSKRVVCQGVRPRVPWNWPHRIRSLLHKCWLSEPEERPGTDAVVAELRGILFPR